MDNGQDSQIYCRTLYTLGHGCALWGPEPNDDLPSEYRESGTGVGDVGLVTSDGRFDFLFNICLPEDHPINQYNGVPPGFEPLEWDKKCLRRVKWFRPQKPICSKDSTQWSLDVEANASMFGLPVGAGGGIGVIFSRERGAVVMPGMDGADRTDASNKALFIEYAARHGMSWYQFVNGTLGREADNGELYLITGFDKTNVWENAVVYNRSTTKSCQVAFTTGGLGAEGRLKLSNSTTHEISLISRCSSDEDHQNQSLFIRGFRISVRQGIRAKFASKVKVTSTYRSSQSEVLDKISGGVPFGGFSTLSPVSSPGGTSVADGPLLTSTRHPSVSDSDSEETRFSSGESATSIEEDDFVPDTKIHHPLVAINAYILRTQADSTVVVSHDNDWISLLDSERDGGTLPDDATLITRFREKMSVVVNADGHARVFKNSPLTGKRKYSQAKDAIIVTLLKEVSSFVNQLVSRDYQQHDPYTNTPLSFAQQPEPATNLKNCAASVEQLELPIIVALDVVTPDDVDSLFHIFHTRINPVVSLLDPAMHTPAFTLARCPCLFDVICAISLRYYAEKLAMYPVAMLVAKHSVANTLASGRISVEFCQACILLSMYVVPVRRWEEDRTWIYTNLAIRSATQLKSHMSPATKPHNEQQEREILNRTRTWMICFNLDRSTATQFGRPPIMKEDSTIRTSADWYKKSRYNLDFDIHLCAHTVLLRIVARFHEEMFSDPSSPNGSNKAVDVRTVIMKYDEHLFRYEEEWSKIFKGQPKADADPGAAFRCRLLPFFVAYSRLVIFSFGFHQAIHRDPQPEDNIFLTKSLESAKAVVACVVDSLALGGYLRYAPDGHFLCTCFAAAFLLKVLRPDFSSLLPDEEKSEIYQLIARLIQTLSSPNIAIDDRHTPKLYARFLTGLLSHYRRDGATIPVRLLPKKEEMEGVLPIW
ncbi:hypothetical protein PM082_016631 [Marasmius tenuissimus]|nr:hypothetical protein PM082_016631 [Marasmius tenuissimus]